MASSIVLKRLLTSSLTRPVVPLCCKTVATGGVVPSRFLSRGITTFPLFWINFGDSNRLVTMSRILDVLPIPSFSCSISMERTDLRNILELSMCIDMPGVEEMKETDEGLYVLLKMPGLKKEDVKAYIEHDKLFITAKKPEKLDYNMSIIKLPENVNRTSEITVGEMQHGRLNVILPVNKELKANDFDFANCSRLAANSFSDAFNPSKAGRIVMSLLSATLPVIRSFSMYTKQNDKCFSVMLNFPGLEDMRVTMRDGVCAYIKMPGLRMEDVKSSIDQYNNLFIEGKTQNEHYITGINLRDYDLASVKADDMKQEMLDGMYKVALPWVNYDHLIKN